MKDRLALQLVSKVMGGAVPDDTIDQWTQDLLALATLKFDDYEQYRPGVKFLESLSVWLDGFEVRERETALDFILNRLVFLGRAELDSLIACAYPDRIRPLLIQKTATKMSLQPWKVCQILNSNEFRSQQRRMLVLGLSDGAHLDRLRRETPFSTEQFHLSPSIEYEKMASMAAKLGSALVKMGLPLTRSFSSVLVVEDFAGSGSSLIREEAGSWTGKLVRVKDEIDKHVADGTIEPGAPVHILVYLVTSTAKSHIQDSLHQCGLANQGFDLVTCHTLEPDLALDANGADANFVALCKKYFKSAWGSEHTDLGAGDFSLGYGAGALPLVLVHNTPNNTPPMVWRDEISDPPFLSEDSGLQKPWVGVFPRYERHHSDRP